MLRHAGRRLCTGAAAQPPHWRRPYTVADLWAGISQRPASDRTSLARAITLVESTRPDHRALSQQLLSLVLASLRQQSAKPATLTGEQCCPPFRIGLSGPPGVGKSTFIETLGMFLVGRGHRVAVLAVDPSSSMTGGSILGDKTRMYNLSRHDCAYVRPSPTSGTLGGVARNTTEAMMLCEAAGYDVVLVETVGVGQSETLVADMVDMFALLVPPGGGDELQGIKKGIVELADLIVINKADGNLQLAAQMTQIEYVSALKLLKPRSAQWRPHVVPVSAAENRGIDVTWKAMMQFYSVMMSSGEFDAKRRRQRKKWMWRLISDTLMYKLKSSNNVADDVERLEQQVAEGRITPGQAADLILDKFLRVVVHESGGNGGS